MFAPEREKDIVWTRIYCSWYLVACKPSKSCLIWKEVWHGGVKNTLLWPLGFHDPFPPEPSDRPVVFQTLLTPFKKQIGMRKMDPGLLLDPKDLKRSHHYQERILWKQIFKTCDTPSYEVLFFWLKVSFFLLREILLFQEAGASLILIIFQHLIQLEGNLLLTVGCLAVRWQEKIKQNYLRCFQ